MRQHLKNRLGPLVARLRSAKVAFDSSRATDESGGFNKGTSPVTNYYNHRIKTHPQLFTRFALQSRSLTIRDNFAKAATNGRLDLSDLLAELEIVQTAPELPSRDLSLSYDPQILLALAFYLANTAREDLDTHAAAKIYGFVFSVYGLEVFNADHRLQYVEALADLGHYEALDKFVTLFAIPDLAPLQADLLYVQRSRRLSEEPHSAWLKAMNELYITLGMTPIRLSRNTDLPLMDRLEAEPTEEMQGPKVSVIMPTYSPGVGIRTAVRSLLEQSWKNLEILVVDDASPEEYKPVFQELEQWDTRIRVIRCPKNAGAYMARNAGLAVATGKYVTTHDDDDWSHPDKIAHQVAALENDPSLIATTSSHIRTTEDMEFQRINVRVQYLQLNYSSLMFHREIIERVGAWDTVNRGGDSEFIARVSASYGKERILHISDKPLSFSRVWSGSLTSGEMSRGYFAYSRLLYRSSFRQWHLQQLEEGSRTLRLHSDQRPYAVPTSFEPGARNKDLGHFDIIYVSDFLRQSRSVKYVLQDIKALADAGYRVGYMHLQSPQTTRAIGFPKELFAMQLEGEITQVSHVDHARAKLLIVYDASIGMFADQLTSSVSVQRGLLVHHEFPMPMGEELRTPTLLSQAVSELDRVFGICFEVVGATSNDQRNLPIVLPHRRVLPDKLTWHPHLSLELAPIVPPEDTPVVGFHSFEGSQYRWPTDNQVFESVYCSPHFDTKLYGSIVTARARFNEESFTHIDTFESDELDEAAFLSSIDFWVYYPHDRFRDQVWVPALKAMFFGKVVVLPPRLEPIYGNAAVYASPEDVEGVIADLSRDFEAYASQAKRAQDFVMEKYTQRRFIERVHQVVPTSGRSVDTPST